MNEPIKLNDVEYLLLNKEQKIESGDEMLVRVQKGHLTVDYWLKVSKEMVGYTIPEVGGGYIRRGYIPYPLV